MASHMATDMQRDTMMMQSGQYFQQSGYQPQRAPYDMVDGRGSYGTQDATIIDGNGYYMPPYAPRLTAAAIRSSSMAASHYNPWLHPMHPFHSHTLGGNVFTDRGGGITPVQHQQIENQMREQNQAIQRANYHAASMSHYSAASAYGQEQQQPGLHQSRYSYPDGRSNQSLHFQQGNGFPKSNALAARHSADATPTSFVARTYQQPYTTPSQQQNAAVYEDHRNPSLGQYDPFQLSQQQQHHPQQQQQQSSNLQRNAEAFYYPPQANLTLHNNMGIQGREWSNAPVQAMPRPGWNLSSTPNYHNNWQRDDPRRDPVEDSSYWPGLSTAAVQNANQTLQQQQQQQERQWPRVNGYPVDSLNLVNQDGLSVPPDGHADNNSIYNGVDTTDAIHHDANATAAPPPPSPTTLDKSGVPISTVISDVIWNACAAFMDPELLAISYQRQNETIDREAHRGRMSSSTSMPISGMSASFNGSRGSQSPNAFDINPKHLRAQSHPNQQQGALPVLHPLHRLTLGSTDTTASSEESSASSSEPGTPPSSFPTYLYDDLQHVRDAKPLRDEMQTLKRLSRFGHDVIGNRDRSTPPSLYRQNSFEQKQDKVIDALGLVSPQWRWSAYDEKLMSLAESQGTGTSQANATQTNSQIKRGSSLNTRSNSSGSKGEETYNSGVSAFGNESSPAFRRFAHQVLAQTLSSPTAVILSLLYSLRVPYLAIKFQANGDCHLDEEAKEIFAHPPSAAPFKLFTLGLMIANKHLDDNTFLNKTWSEVTGISLAEINRMERWFLERSSYEIVVPQETWIMFLQRLGIKTDQKLTSSMGHEVFRKASSGHRSSHSLSSIRSSDNALTGLTQEESLKRLLLSVEDALTALGCIASFQLEALTDSVLRQRHTSASPDMNMSTYSEPHPRPGHSLQNLHKQSQSAPVLASTSTLACDVMDSDFDVFDEEEGPYRPQRNRHQSSIEKRSVTDATLGAMFHQDFNTEQHQQRQQYKRQDHQSDSWYSKDLTSKDSRQSSTSAHVGSPLAPSVLLDLLIRGQQFAHANR